MPNLKPDVVLAAAILAGSALPLTDATAQTMHRCSQDGRIYLSDRPCGGEVRPSPSVGAIGPARDPRSMRSVYTPGPPKAATNLSYLSPQCSELKEGMRNGPARGLGSRAMRELQTNYQTLCADDERIASRRMHEDQQREAELRVREERARKLDETRQAISREQCDEMWRIVHSRRQRVGSMAPGERADFDRFESAWRERCPSR